MAKKIIGYIKLQLPAGKATPQPPVGPALGAYGVAIPNFTKEFNERTKNDIGLLIPVVITVYADRSFSFCYCFHRNANLCDKLLHTSVLDDLFEICFDLVFIAGVGMCYIPLRTNIELVKITHCFTSIK